MRIKRSNTFKMNWKIVPFGLLKAFIVFIPIPVLMSIHID